MRKFVSKGGKLYAIWRILSRATRVAGRAGLTGRLRP